MGEREAEVVSEEDAWETKCSKSADGWHCTHWYDGGECHACGDPAQDDTDGEGSHG